MDNLAVAFVVIAFLMCLGEFVYQRKLWRLYEEAGQIFLAEVGEPWDG